MSRRYTSSGQRDGDYRAGYQATRRADGGRLEREREGRSRLLVALACLAMVTMLVIAANGDLILGSLQ